MGESITTYLLENAPWLAALLVAVVATAFVVWKVCRWYSRQEEINRKVETLPCAERGKEIDSLHSFEKSFADMSERFDEVCKWLMKFDGSTIDTIAPKHSPRRMNSIGLEIFEETGARKALEDNMPALLSEMEKKSPETAYDVEDRAFEVLLSNLQEPMFIPIKNYLYSCPSRVRKTGEDGKEVEVDLTMGLLIRLMSIRLRDAYLERHPELTEIAENDSDK